MVATVDPSPLNCVKTSETLTIDVKARHNYNRGEINWLACQRALEQMIQSYVGLYTPERRFPLSYVA